MALQEEPGYLNVIDLVPPLDPQKQQKQTKKLIIVKMQHNESF